MEGVCSLRLPQRSLVDGLVGFECRHLAASRWTPREGPNSCPTFCCCGCLMMLLISLLLLSLILLLLHHHHLQHTAQPNHYTTSLPHYTAPPHHRTTTLHRATTPPHHHTTPRHHTTEPPHHHTTALPHYTAPLHHCTTTLHRITTLPQHLQHRQVRHGGVAINSCLRQRDDAVEWLRQPSGGGWSLLVPEGTQC